jgi:hypothetical protein
MNEQGSMLPFMAALLFVGLVVVGVALDATMLAATYREVAFSADVGAEAGAAMITDDGSLRLDPDHAEATGIEAALAARPRSGRTAAADAGPDRICVVVTDAYEPWILGAVGVGPTEISVEACAEPSRG